MGAWQPASGEMPAHHASTPHAPSPLQYGPQHPQRQANTSASTSAPTPTGTSSSGFSRVGGGRSHIDSPYSIVHGTNNSQPLPAAAYNPSSSTQAFPSIGQAGSNMLAPPPSTPSPRAGPQQYRQVQAPAPQNHPPSSFSRHQQGPQAGAVFAADDDDAPLPLSTVRQAQTAAVASSVQPQQYEAEYGLPPGAMQPAHVRTKSQTAIVEDAGYLYQPSNPNSASHSGLSARLQNPLRPLKLSGHRTASSGSAGSSPMYGAPPPSAPARFTLNAEGEEEDDDADSTQEDQQQKKKWYQIRKKRPHSSEGRTTTATTASSSANNSSNPLPLDAEFGASTFAEGSATPQRSFVVVRKPAGSMSRLNQPPTLPMPQQGGNTTPRSKHSRPPTR